MNALFFVWSIYKIENFNLICFTILVYLIFLAIDIHRIGYYTPFVKKESKSHLWKARHSFKIVSSNVHILNKSFEKVLKLVDKEKPDLVLLLETDEEWNEGVKKLKDDYPFSILIPQDNTYGMLLYSKYEFQSEEINYLIDKKVPSIYAKFRLEDTRDVHLFCVHPRPPRPGEASSLQRDAELVEIASRVKQLKDEPVLVIGDMNDVAWSHTTRLFKRLSNTLDPRIGRGFFNTFPVKYKIFSVPLDHAFHTKHLGMVNMNVLNSIDSDHFPISISFQVLDQKQSSNAKKADDGDFDEAEKTKSEAKEWDGPVKKTES